METQQWTTLDKSTWGAGQWQNEPDKKQWQDEATKLPCLAVRHPMSGHWCGYVGVTEGHPWFGLGASWDDGVDASVHGGITFAEFCQPENEPGRGVCHVPGPGEPDHVWWLGFDCHHSGDFAPAYAARYQDRYDGYTYKSLEYVESQCRKLAAQAVEIAKEAR